MNKDIEVWKQRNEILHKKVERLMEEIRDLQSNLDRTKKENNDCFNRIAESLEVNESHQRLNGKLQMKITELEQDNLELHVDNKKISRQVEDQVERARKAGL